MTAPDTVIDKKALGIYLGIAFGVSWLLAIIMLVAGGLTGDGNMLREGALLVGLMLLPAAAALVASTLTGDKEHPRMLIWPMAPRPVLTFALLAPLAYILVYGLSAALGFATVDWGVSALQAEMPDPQDVGLQQQLPAFFLMVAGFLLSIVLGPTLFALIALGGEIGWRAYLVPKLAPLGRWQGSALAGLMWGLSWLPLVFVTAWSGDASFLQAVSMALRALVAATLFGMILAEVFRRTQHVGLTAVCAGCFFAQEFGIWNYLVPRYHATMAGPLGLFGLTGMVALVLVVYLMPAWERLLGLAPPAEDKAAEAP